MNTEKYSQVNLPVTPPTLARWALHTLPNCIRNPTMSSHSGGNASEIRAKAGRVGRKNTGLVSLGNTEKHT